VFGGGFLGGVWFFFFFGWLEYIKRKATEGDGGRRKGGTGVERGRPWSHRVRVQNAGARPADKKKKKRRSWGT